MNDRLVEVAFYFETQLTYQ